MRLIDADALLEKLKDSRFPGAPYIDAGISIAIGKVLDAPIIEERKTGLWILVKGSNGKDYHKCSCCLHTQEITGVKNYCSVCGADMMEVEHDSV